MPHRDHAPDGMPCWADLWTSDVQGSRAFYADVFGWEAGEPSPEFGGYFMFARDGQPVAGAMGDMGDAPADNRWKLFLASPDIDATMRAADAAGAQVVVPPVAVADLGVQAVLVDPTGARVGVWQPGSFPGFTVVGEPGAPSWFELHTRQHAQALDFYRSVFGWAPDLVADTDEFRYATVSHADGGEQAGIMDASGFLPEGDPGYWTIYWEVPDVAAALARVSAGGGTTVAGPEDTPYGVVATAADTAGATFRLRRAPT